MPVGAAVTRMPIRLSDASAPWLEAVFPAPLGSSIRSAPPGCRRKCPSMPRFRTVGRVELVGQPFHLIGIQVPVESQGHLGSLDAARAENRARVPRSLPLVPAGVLPDRDLRGGIEHLPEELLDLRIGRELLHGLCRLPLVDPEEVPRIPR